MVLLGGSERWHSVGTMCQPRCRPPKSVNLIVKEAIEPIMVLYSENKNCIKTKNGTPDRSTGICATVDAGICGFACRIKAWQTDKRAVGLEIGDSECRQIRRLANLLSRLSLKEVFMPVTRNPVYLAAQHSGCHPSCPIPAAVLKAAEVAMGMALAHDASIRFEPCTKKGDV